MSDTIVLNGLMWDTENLEVNGETHFTYEEAKIEATKLGKRLPTKKEFSKLLKLPHSWDNLKKGMWFAEREEDLKSEKSLFLPAYGYNIDKRDLLDYFGVYGDYWSITSNSTYHAYYFGFSGIKNRTYINYYYRYGCFSVRCINDSYNEKKKRIMKLIKSTIKRDKPIGELPHGKVKITMPNEQPENIWVAKDEENKVMYLLNHAFMFYPVPSWGMELPLTLGSIDLHKYRGDTFEETQFTVCEEAYNGLKDFLDEEGNFNVEGYIVFCNSEADKAPSAEE